ncbi:MAG: HD domain-containing protein [Flavobacteriales bacterium]
MSAVKEFYDNQYGSVMRRLRFELNVKYLYHDSRHTEDVIQQTEEIAGREGMNTHEIELLKLAALYHDTGFLRQREDHESVSVELFLNEAIDSDITQEDKDHVCRLIMVTRVPQQPSTLLESIICDADLDYLGREDFPAIAEYLYLEFKANGIVDNRKRWNEIQLTFLENHRFHTSSSQNLRSMALERNIQFVKKMLATL